MSLPSSGCRSALSRPGTAFGIYVSDSSLPVSLRGRLAGCAGYSVDLRALGVHVSQRISLDGRAHACPRPGIALSSANRANRGNCGRRLACHAHRLWAWLRRQHRQVDLPKVPSLGF